MIRVIFWCGVALAAITASVGWGSVDRSFTYFRDNAYEREAALQQCLEEPQPRPEDIELHTYAPSSVDVVYPNDYTGLP